MKRVLLVVLVGVGAAAWLARPRAPDSSTTALTVSIDAAGTRTDLGGGSGLTLGAAIHVGNLAVWPVHGPTRDDLDGFLTLQEAQQAERVEIREIGADAGHDSRSAPERARATVETIEIASAAEQPILIPGGTVIRGGKQDRQIAEDTVIAPRTTVRVRTFCIERGRWSAHRDGVSTEGRFRPSRYVASSPIRFEAQYNRDQGRVWSRVARSNDGGSSGRSARTSSLFETLDDGRAAIAEQRARVEREIRTHFASFDSVTGFAYAVNGTPVSVRTFADPHLFRQHFPTFVASIAIEAEVARDASSEHRASTDDVIALVAAIDRARPRLVETDAGNRNRIRATDAGAGSECFVRSGGDWIPISRDWTARPRPVSEPRHLSRLRR